MTETPVAIFRHSRESTDIAFAWLLRLRWGAVLCQLLLIAIVTVFYDLTIPIPVILLLIFCQAASNLYFQFRHRRGRAVQPGLLGFIMIWDIANLTLLLYFTGGPMNPFTFLYLVHVALGALIMRRRWAWGLALLTVAAYALLFLVPLPSVHGTGLVAGQELPACNLIGIGLHLEGMWLAYTLTAFFIVYFLGQLREALAQQQQTLDQLDDARRRSEKLASLATLAAGAAHEFSTPLSTIAVAAAEMEDLLRENDGDPELLADAVLIRAEVRKCRDILRQLAADAGEHPGEPFVEITLAEMLTRLLATFTAESGRQARLATPLPELTLYLPLQTWIRTLKGLLKNGTDADPGGEPVCGATLEGEWLEITVSDRGGGMSDEVLARAGEPFFTTKEPGRGLGLGLFLTRTLAERYGGQLMLASQPGAGTRVSLRVRRDQVTRRREGAGGSRDIPASGFLHLKHLLD